METSDFIIAGGGIIGIRISLALREKYPHASIILLEKEKTPGEHSSGRNSGVLHAGFYYTENSLKAKFTRQGNEELTRYALSRKLKINRCGKLVVAQNPQEEETLRLLHERGKNNGVDVSLITEREARQLEPRVKTHGSALYSPSTSSIDPREIVLTLAHDAEQKGIQIHTGEKYVSREGKSGGDGVSIKTSGGKYSTGYFINAAGLYADTIAHGFGMGTDFMILPFKGLYLYSAPVPHPLKMHIYPVPDLRNPFLGVHHTVDSIGRNEIGPTAIPAFWKENYRGVGQFNLREMLSILWTEGRLFLGFGKKGFDFRSLALQEVKKYSRSYLVKVAGNLAEDVQKKDYTLWGHPGIRAQLYNKKENLLEMDFKMEYNSRSMHILNAVSPAFTASGPFARYVVEKIGE